MRPLSFRGTRGYSLLEAIMGAIIFAVVSVALLGVWQMQMDAMLKSKEMAIAAHLAERYMEECVAAGFERVEDLYPTGVEQTQTVRSKTRSGVREAEYKTIVRVADHPGDSTNQKSVVVEVSYTDAQGSRTVKFHTLVNKRG